ncbi:sugar transferase [Schleiferiaceae bacterium]|jgi:hypothetical protein|nr:sugar transferase [Schleiferiaceae bacterium]
MSWENEPYADFIEKHTRGKNIKLFNQEERGSLDVNSLNTIISLSHSNKQRWLNKHLESINKMLSDGGVFIGNAEVLDQKKKAIKSNYPPLLNRLIYFWLFALHRVIPKLPVLKTVYFSLTKGRHRVVSRMEMFGRLYSCGFRISSWQDIDNVLWFAAIKDKPPAYNEKATYGMFIRLKRRGFKNEFFLVYKFRTMYAYSEYLQAFIFENYGLDSGGKFKNDPRVNTIGRFLRKYWIDELPMIINILRGEIKLVGVRPLSSHYFSLYPKELQVLRGKVKPGLLPPYYADLPEGFKEVCDSEEKYIKAYLEAPWKTDFNYLVRILYNILVKWVRSN